MTKPRQFNLKAAAPPSGRRDRPLTLTFGPAGEALPEEGCAEEDAAREWLKHVQAGRIGGA